METATRAAGTNAHAHLIALFDVLHDLLHRADREARTFVENLAGATGSVTQTESQLLQSQMRVLITRLVTEADVDDSAGLISSWNILTRGAIDQGVVGDLNAARRARDIGCVLLTQYRVPQITAYPVVTPCDDYAADYLLEIDEFSHDTYDAAALVPGNGMEEPYETVMAEFY